MVLKPITMNPDEYPRELHNVLRGSLPYDSSCPPEVKVT